MMDANAYDARSRGGGECSSGHACFNMSSQRVFSRGPTIPLKIHQFYLAVFGILEQKYDLSSVTFFIKYISVFLMVNFPSPTLMKRQIA